MRKLISDRPLPRTKAQKQRAIGKPKPAPKMSAQMRKNAKE